MMVFDPEPLAYWDSLGGALASIEHDPKVAMLFRDPASRNMNTFASRR